MRGIQFESLTGIPAIREDDSEPADPIDPVRGDPLMSLVQRTLGLRPLRAAVVFLLLQYGTILLALVAVGALPWSAPFAQTAGLTSVDHLNLAILVPLGAALLCHLYRQIRTSFDEIHARGIVTKDRRDEFLAVKDWAQRAYDAPLPLLICLFLTGALNGYFVGSHSSLFTLVLEPEAGLTAQNVVLVYARLWICVNYLVVFLLFYRSAITILALYRITSLDLNIEPMHPDRAGGLSCLGELSMAVISVLSLVMLFLSLTGMYAKAEAEALAVAGNGDGNSEIYLLLLIAFAVLTVTGFLASLSPAHDKMRKVKADALVRLEIIARRQYKRFLEASDNLGAAEETDRDLIEEMNAVDQLYGVVQKMPVWPFDFSMMRRFASSIALPLMIYVVNEVVGFREIVEYLRITFG